jgi:hypothetical protein
MSSVCCGDYRSFVLDNNYTKLLPSWIHSHTGIYIYKYVLIVVQLNLSQVYLLRHNRRIYTKQNVSVVMTKSYDGGV